MSREAVGPKEQPCFYYTMISGAIYADSSSLVKPRNVLFICIQRNCPCLCVCVCERVLLVYMPNHLT